MTLMVVTELKRFGHCEGLFRGQIVSPVQAIKDFGGYSKQAVASRSRRHVGAPHGLRRGLLLPGRIGDMARGELRPLSKSRQRFNGSP
jgi:hypothetical protein